MAGSSCPHTQHRVTPAWSRHTSRTRREREKDRTWGGTGRITYVKTSFIASGIVFPGVGTGMHPSCRSRHEHDYVCLHVQAAA
jgi:hypothetical protein